MSRISTRKHQVDLDFDILSKHVGNNSSPHVESSTPVTKLSSSSGNKNNKSSKGKEKLTSNHCGMNGDTVEKNSTSTSTSLTFTQEQCQLFLAMLGTYSTSMAEFVANNSELGSPTISEERIPSLIEYSFTPSAKLESVRSVLNGTNPIPANNTYTDANGARSLSISLLFPPAMSEIETDDSCSESNEAPHAAAQFSNSVLNGTNPIPTNNSDTDANGARSLSISLLFPPAMSEIDTDDSRSKSNETPRAAAQFSYSISSCFPPAKSKTNSSKRPRHTILTTRFKGVEIIVREKFPLKMLLEATNNFSRDCEIGKNGFGSLYRAILDDGRKVTIHRAEISMSEQLVNEFPRRVEAWFRLDHKNVVRLLGFCEDGKDGLLVYEYMEYGTLSGHLHNPKSTSLMSWAARIKVALDIASGIEYLHVYAVPPIIHRNIKSSNIFLDATLTAKLSNFNRSTNASKWSDHVINTAIDLDPEFRSTLLLTTRVDVYSFGKVLLEMLSGSKKFHADDHYEERCIVDFVAPYIVQKKIHKFLDPKVPPPTPLEMEALANVATLALDCVNIKSVLLPSMTKVANTIQSTLEGILQGQVIAYNSIAFSCGSISDAESESSIDAECGSSIDSECESIIDADIEPFEIYRQNILREL
ncbi:hypothetical protein CMV_027743 [Castanea mollissima]|uniref:Protein kinase domain-containing protein n=1 Tax=Castanea mollissima TaxID=60419 RepID=A0A8J4QB86_9ROSI|nr:hypothetical protein CMV_027743 [Castanea mollissima]